MSTISSAYNRILTISSAVETPIFSSFKSFTRSFIKIEKSVGERLSPYLTPASETNQSDKILLSRTQFRVLEYMALIAL